ncbi:MAG TPA: deoxyribose-phosphate aldolase [Syntrophomonadaceae bacterium]|nr:deoxyribose-phosphate aldolase [Syntrophomonadaceae bacterium]
MLASHLDSTLLKPDATADQVRTLCEEAAFYGMAAVCIQPCRLPIAAPVLRNTKVKLGTVVGFPLGAGLIESKIYEAHCALETGAQELDMVINIGAVKDNSYDLVRREISLLMSLKQDHPFTAKIIVETALLNQQEIINLTQLVGECGADYIKTSTGFAARGVNMEDIRLINSIRNPELKIKASGGIRTLDFALELIEAGADRLGTSNAGALVREYQEKFHMVNP